MKGFQTAVASLALGCLLFLLLLFPDSSMQGARDGLLLFGNSVLPALLPFFVLSSLLAQSGLFRSLGLAGRLLGLPFRLGGAAGSVLPLCLLTGAPNSARLTAELCRQGLMHEEEAARLLAAGVLTGPLFLIGTASALLGSPALGAFVYVVQLLCALLNGLLWRGYGKKGATPAPKRSGPAPSPFQTLPNGRLRRLLFCKPGQVAGRPGIYGRAGERVVRPFSAPGCLAPRFRSVGGEHRLQGRLPGLLAPRASAFPALRPRRLWRFFHSLPIRLLPAGHRAHAHIRPAALEPRDALLHPLPFQPVVCPGHPARLVAACAAANRRAWPPGLWRLSALRLGRTPPPSARRPFLYFFTPLSSSRLSRTSSSTDFRYFSRPARRSSA